MTKLIVEGKTDSIINLNKTGIPIRGKTRAILSISTEDQMNEVNGLVRAGLLEILSDDSGLPNHNKNIDKPINELAKEEQKRTDEAESLTQKTGSRVVIGTQEGPKFSRMSRSAIDDIPDSEKTMASLEAMKKLEKEEKEEIILPDAPVDESKLDPSEQMGRKAIISTYSGTEDIKMVNSILPEADSVNKIDPFIDRKDKEEEKLIEKESMKKDESKKEDSKNNEETEGDDYSDAFIKF